MADTFWKVSVVDKKTGVIRTIETKKDGADEIPRGELVDFLAQFIDGSAFIVTSQHRA